MNGRRAAAAGPTRRHCCLAALGAPLTALAAAARSSRILSVGPGERFGTLHDALQAAQAGDTIELQPGDHVGDVAVVERPQLTVRGLADRGGGPGAVLHAGGRDAEGKAILVVRGNDVTVENIEFRGARVPSGNGAGIRFESGSLSVRRCRFFDNENGILAANRDDMTLHVDACAFGAAPRHAGLLHHLLYVGTIGRFTLTDSRFENGWRGHLVKSRARRNWIRGNLLIDAPNGEASYELEFPNGSHNVVVGNVIVQSALTDNPVIVSMGAEAAGSADASLLMSHNTLVNEAGANAEFVRVWTNRLPVDTPVRLFNNLFAGAGSLRLAAGWDGGGNHRVDTAALRDPAHGDFRLVAGSPLLGSAVPVDAALRPPGHDPTRRSSPGARQAVG